MPHTASHERQRPAEPPRSGIELSTLLVAGLASVIAATVVSQVWSAGTVWATAFTPIIVSLVKEALERPARKVSAVATKAVTTPRVVDRSAPPPPVVVDQEQLVEEDSAFSERKDYGRPARGRLERRWKVAIVTGLLAFAGVVALFTLPELVAGKSVTSGSSHTTFFGGHRSSSSSSTTKTETTGTTSTTKTTTTPAQTTSTPTTTAPTTTTTTPTTTTPPAQTTTTPAPSAAPPATTTTTPAP